MHKNIFNYWVIKAARNIGVEWAALSAVVKIESGGKLFAQIDGAQVPLIRFEGHYFDKLLAPSAQAQARIMGLASPKAGVVKNPKSQVARWHLLAKAQRIDSRAALMSTSWGIGQVMGANYHWLGFTTVDALVALAKLSPKGQLDLMMRYITRAKLIPALQALDFIAFAKAYNGPSYAKFGYHIKLQQAYRANLEKSPPAQSEREWLQLGDIGPRVQRLQRRLTEFNFEVALDSDYGPQTYQSVRAFQEQNSLAIDGIAGPQTLNALQKK